ncbi:MAG: GAF domain-containing protein [Aureliella sp.]
MINETRQAEILRILQSSADERVLYERFLTWIAQASSAEIAVAWDCAGTPRPICQAYRNAGSPLQLELSEQMHAKLICDAKSNSKAHIVQPRMEGRTDVASPKSMMLFGPIHGEQRIVVVELILTGASKPELVKETLRDLDYFCQMAPKFNFAIQNERATSQYKNGEANESSSSSVSEPKEILAGDLDQYAHRIHASLDLDDTLRVIVNEARRVLNCDRVSIAVRKGKKYSISAISGQPSVNKRSNMIQTLQKLAARALATEQALWVPDEASPLPPQIERPLQEYLGFSETRTLAVVPVFQKSAEDHKEEPVAKRTENARDDVVAGIIVEHCNRLWMRDEMEPALEPVCRHASDAIRNSLEHRAIFGFGLLKTLGRTKAVVSARNLPKTVAIAAAILIGTLALVFVPAPFTLHSQGVLLPKERQKVFATVEGEVASINVEHRSRVREQAQLLSLRNENLELQMKELLGEIATLETRLNHEYLLHGQQTNRNDLSEQVMQSNSAALEKQKKSLEEQVFMLREKTSKLNILSPIDGEVITWDLQDRLASRPVKPGELLLEVADVAGDWEVELNLPERRVGHLLREIENRRIDGNDQALRVVYQPAAEPGVQFEGRVIEVGRSLQMNADKSQSLRVLVSIDTADVDQIRQYRSSVSAKIYCGEKSLGYVWLHEVFEFVQSKVLFRIW